MFVRMSLLCSSTIAKLSSTSDPPPLLSDIPTYLRRLPCILPRRKHLDDGESMVVRLSIKKHT